MSLTRFSYWLRGDRPELGPDQRERLALETARNRIFITGAMFIIGFCWITYGLVDASVLRQGNEPAVASGTDTRELKTERADIVDRNGMLLATDLPTNSLYADARVVKDPVESADLLLTVLPDLDRDTLIRHLSSRKAFVWLRRNLTPEQQYEVNSLGIPGLNFQREERRVYPHGRLLSHALGFTDIDNNGIAGAEREFDNELRINNGPLELSLDTRVQYALAEEVETAMETYSAVGAAGLVMDVYTGEVVAMTSLPNFDPHRPGQAPADARFNRPTLGVYEMGSVFKLFNTAIALETGTSTLNSVYDATEPLAIGGFRIRDYHAENRWLTLPEILVHSSNIGSARMAMAFGGENQRKYLKKLGMLDKPQIELPEVGGPLVPNPWREINTMTISFGHGLAVTPLQVVSGISTIVNGGIRRPATILKQDGAPAGERVFSQKTSELMRRLMRLVVTEGSGKKAEVAGYFLGGKTGTSEKLVNGRYVKNARMSTFVAAFPMQDPKYVVLVTLDEPKGTKETYGFATAGWVSAPAVGKVVTRIAPLLGIEPANAKAPEIEQALQIELRKGERKLASF
ncbi:MULTISPECIES: penicillin-binding protein 2 [Thalassospira]|jgi:cell division protein FtsI (penicillin-binding protein 3)|uniref:Penicillin-binding protein n=1 Tax=Thalassospira profundimaris TaxID=502049 RepID=A0A367VKF8_9PROT|nr:MULTISPECIES: penicillin-binding protein 2 [Thalassospira]MBR9899617.1 penicillin-binding protein 2 [Rhodospirillales bacterium]KZB70698.1 penicillin-binding protein [Thalassospira sp. MCCC 1A01148]MBO6805622.1 penicillin-binding protein 2 [Thalassospira sp.]MBO6841252.1 penicillin-binding protein 2 [Thalassospira sp.]RCK25673.1 penicillin-binding protein [Thalassospira profundimaris]|tara:strand:+ start:17653 stop:19371 length:1719 start_codon:yes stop_codon:yes gene_type:complete